MPNPRTYPKSRPGSKKSRPAAKNGRADGRRHETSSNSIKLTTSPFRDARGWDPAFSEHRSLILSTENKPYIDTKAEILELSNAETASDLGGESFVRVFMQDTRDSTICLPRADRVDAICRGASLNILLEAKGDGNQEHVALLSERGFVGKELCSRPSKGQLTARDLYHALKEPRFRCWRSVAGVPTPTGENSAGGQFEKDWAKEPDADRRLIFITDLDRWTIYALVGTASRYQAPALRDAIYRHVAFKTFIGVTFASAGLPMFQLSFSLPYFVWRTSSAGPSDDNRRDANGRPLRQCENVTYLVWQRSQEPLKPVKRCFLYEAQISCMIAGPDIWRWVGYCFVDTYFDRATKSERETVEQYCEDGQGEDGAYMDPFTYGVNNAEDQFHDPREYFLTVFEIRIHQIRCEWEQVVAKVGESIREYDISFHHSLSESSQLSSEETQVHKDSVRSSRNRIIKIWKLTRNLSQQLSATVDAFENFGHKYAGIFHESPRSTDVISALRTTFDELEALKKTLDSLAGRCDLLTKDLELQIQVESNDVGIRQHNAAQDGNLKSTIILLVISPVALAAQVLALDPLFIPFIPPSFTSLMLLTTIFLILGIISQRITFFVKRYQIWCWNFLLALNGQKQWSRSNRGWLRPRSERETKESVDDDAGGVA